MVHRRLLLVVDEDHDDVGGLGGFGGGGDLQAGGLGLGPALGAVVQADDDVDAALMQVQGMSMALGAIADDGHGLVLEHAEVAVVLVVDFCHNVLLLCRLAAKFYVIYGGLAKGRHIHGGLIFSPSGWDPGLFRWR